MKILLTGASGFVGSHILDDLRARSLPCSLLIRRTSNTRFLREHLPSLETRVGSLSDPELPGNLMEGITHIIHCAGCTRAARTADFYVGNQAATRRLVAAANSAGIERLIYISSLAAAGPSLPGSAKGENDPEEPVSDYGKSKLEAEKEIRQNCSCDFVILRPSAVYGPRDPEFLRLFKAVRRHVLPASTQPLSLVYVSDLAKVAVECLTQKAAVGRAWFVAHPQSVTVREMGEHIAAALGVSVMSVPMPPPMLWALCLAAQARSVLLARPAVLNLQKYAELRAPGWVCETQSLSSELGLECRTNLEEGLRRTLTWYKEHRWI